MQSGKDVDFMIVGMGLAGAALALALRAKGQTVMVLDRADEDSASRRAAGLITTLAGKGMNPAWRQSEYLPVAIETYQGLEKDYGVPLFFPLPVVRPFDDEKQAKKFARKQQDIEQWTNEEFTIPDGVRAESGAFSMTHSGRLDTYAYLDLVKRILQEDGQYEAKNVSLDDVSFNELGGEVGEFTFKKIIFCTGFDGLNQSYLDGFEHRSAKGEMLTVRIKGLSQDQIINCNGWLVPLGDSLWRAGATYQWDDLTTKPTEQGRLEVESKITALVDLPYEVVEHNAGIRPIVNRSQPMIGYPQANPHLAVFNGLGSKGVITSHSVAMHFADHLVDGVGIDPELDVNRLK